MDKKAYLEMIDEIIAQGPYRASWDSLGSFQPPQWYRDAKFGIFIHWGIYSVPAFSNEWYSRNMYMEGSPEFEHHVSTYGPHKEFGYKDFIPEFKAEKFDAKEWVSLFKKAGARYVIPVAEHHDGFQMYQSDISHWNASEMGPKRDVLGELTEAMAKEGIHHGASTHRAEHWFFMGHGRDFASDITDQEKEGDFYWPAEKEAEHQDLFSKPVPSRAFLEDWLIRTCEIVDRYRPKIVYFDWWIQHQSFKPYLKKFAAYYYNRAWQWGEDVAINYKHDAFMFGTAVVDVERGHFADIKPFFWQTDTAVARNSWCHTQNLDYKSADEILRLLADVVSKNGTLLLNIGPKADGTIPQEDAKILAKIGDWLQVHGEAIYGTKCWRTYGEGPTEIKEGQFTDGQATVYTAEDIRFTVKGSSLYATVLRFPENGQVTIKSLGLQDASHKPVFSGIIRDVFVLGYDTNPEFRRDADGLHVTAPFVQTENPVVFKVKLD